MATVQCKVNLKDRLRENKQLAETEFFTSYDELKKVTKAVENSSRFICFVDKLCKLIMVQNLFSLIAVSLRAAGDLS